MTPNKNEVKKWCEALRSGEHLRSRTITGRLVYLLEELCRETGKKFWAMRYYDAYDIIKYYQVPEEECLVFSPVLLKAPGFDDLIHLKPDRYGRWELKDKSEVSE